MKVAVILYGYLRTWNICRENIIKTFTDNFSDIDWYLELWNTTTSTYDEVEDFFKVKNQNIVNFDFIKSDKNSLYVNYENSWMQEWAKYKTSRHNSATIGPGYLKQKGSLNKKINEFNKGIIYDLTFYIRPDAVYYKIRDFDLNAHKTLSRFEYSGDLTIQYSDKTTYSNDVCQIAGVFASDLIGYFYLDNNNDTSEIIDYTFNAGFDVHSEAANFLIDHRLCKGNYLWNYKTRIVRPSVDLVQLNEDLTKEWNSLDVIQIIDYDDGWNLRTSDVLTKREWFQYHCNKSNIDIEDYYKLYKN